MNKCIRSLACPQLIAYLRFLAWLGADVFRQFDKGLNFELFRALKVMIWELVQTVEDKDISSHAEREDMQ